MASEQQQQAQEEPKTVPLKVLIDRQNNKVVAVEATKDFVDTLFSFLSLPLATIIRLLTNDQQQQPSFLGNIKNLYQSVQALTPDDVWNPFCKQMLLNPGNPCELLCNKLFLNIDDTLQSRKLFVCDSCNKVTAFQNLYCTCGKPTNRQPKNLDSEGQGNGGNLNGVFVKDNGSMFLVFDDLKIVPSSLMISAAHLMELGYSDLSKLDQVTHNIGKQEILNLLKYSLTSHEPLTNTILKSSSKNKESPPNQFASAVRVRPCTSNVKMDVKLSRSKSQKKIIFAEANENFVDFMFSFLTIPLGSIVKLLDGNSFIGCVDNLYKSVETLDSSWCTDSRSVLLNPGLSPQCQYGSPKLLLNIPDAQPPPQPPITYYYGTGTPKVEYSTYHGSLRIIEEKIEGGVISTTRESIYNAKILTALDPRSHNGLKEGVGFVKRPALYGIGDDLKVKPLSANSCLSYLKELSLPLDDLEMKVISIGEAEALSLLAASLTSKFTLSSGLEDFFNVPKQESNLTSKYIKTSRLDELAKEPIPEA